ncbi:MAG: ABC transporter permease subunit [Alphaproteobacteria bacterium]|nr:MAG: ABC transporter permease subunit [Alphaproteobacteria bacterium]
MNRAVILALVLVVGGPWLAPYDPMEQNLLAVLLAPTWDHWLGTDHLGRDVLSRVLAGAPRSLGLALGCVGTAVALGCTLGLMAATGGRWLGALIMRGADLVLAFPGLLLALLLAGFLGGGVGPMLFGLTLTLWPQYARMTQAVARRALAEPPVEAARLAGFTTLAILSSLVLPVVLRALLPLATLGVGQAILSISALGFLGLGLRPPEPEWGAMINDLLPVLTEAPVQMAAPCLAILTAVLGLTLAGRTLLARQQHSL